MDLLSLSTRTTDNTCAQKKGEISFYLKLESGLLGYILTPRYQNGYTAAASDRNARSIHVNTCSHFKSNRW